MLAGIMPALASDGPAIAGERAERGQATDAVDPGTGKIAVETGAGVKRELYHEVE